MPDYSYRFTRGRMLQVASLALLPLLATLIAHSPRAGTGARGPLAQLAQLARASGAPRLDIELPTKDFEKLSAELARRSALGRLR